MCEARTLGLPCHEIDPGSQSSGHYGLVADVKHRDAGGACGSQQHEGGDDGPPDRVGGRRHLGEEQEGDHPQAARKKATLQELASGSLHLSLTGNETVPILKVKCLNEAYKVAEVHESDIMGFGKHAEKSYIEAAQDSNYVEWAKRICAEESTNHRLQRWVPWLNTIKAEDMTLQLQNHKDNKKKETAMSGKKKEISPRAGEFLEKLTTAVEELTKEVAMVWEERATSSAELPRKARPVEVIKD